MKTKKTKTKKLIYIADIRVDPSINFVNRQKLAGPDYWAAFTHWPLSVEQNGTITPLATGGSWYHMKKFDYSLSASQFYMNEKLGARTEPQKNECAKQFQDAFQNGTLLQGTIDSIISQKNKGRTTALKATIDLLGEIIMIDGVGHPQISKWINKPGCTVYGRGNYPWAPIADAKKLLKVYKMR